MNFVEELRWRGMVHTMMPGTEELLSKEMVTAYLGIDPTADSLHIGHLCGVMMLRHFQRCGHKPLALIGGATGMIGDPSGKSQERNLLNEETLRHNVACIKEQLARFLDFDSDAPNKAELVNNYDWMREYSFLDFAREIGKCITVNYMMAKDSVKRRLNGEFQRERGICTHLPPHHQGRRQEVRKDRTGQHLAGPQPHHSLRLLPVLAERGRRRCRTLYQDLHQP